MLKEKKYVFNEVILFIILSRRSFELNWTIQMSIESHPEAPEIHRKLRSSSIYMLILWKSNLRASSPAPSEIAKRRINRLPGDAW